VLARPTLPPSCPLVTAGAESGLSGWRYACAPTAAPSTW